jgi:MSHA pilin protein MshC
MVELIMVMVIVGVLAAVAAPRLIDRSGFSVRTFTDQTRFMLRYAQKLAIAQNRPVYVRLNGSTIALCYNYPTDVSYPACSSANQVLLPEGNVVTVSAACASSTNWYCRDVPAGLAYAVTPVFPVGESYFYFDALGVPFAANDVSPTAISTFARMLLRITGDGSNHDLFIEAETGYVHF